MPLGQTGKPRTGRGGRISINGTNINLQEWSVQEQGEDHDTTNFESTGTEGSVGWTTCNISLKGNWDASNNPFDTPSLYPGAVLTTVKFFENTSDNVFWLFPYARVISATNGGQVRGMVTFEATLQNQGTYTRPTGSV